MLFHFFHKGSRDNLLALYFFHESLKFVKIIRENNRYISTLPTTLPFTCSMGLLDGFPYCCPREFIRFSIYSAKAGTLLFHVAFATLYLESGDSIIFLLLNFGGILQQKSGPIGHAKNMFGGFSSGIHQNIQKAWKLVNVRACHEIKVFLK